MKMPWVFLCEQENDRTQARTLRLEHGRFFGQCLLLMGRKMRFIESFGAPFASFKISPTRMMTLQLVQGDYDKVFGTKCFDLDLE